MADTIIRTDKAVIRQQKVTILKDVTLEIKSGEFVYIIGKVGSGKSSFLKTLYAELPLDYGDAEVAGFRLRKIKKSQVPLLRRKCGIVFQDFKLLTDRSVYDNLSFVLRATGWKNRKALEERIDTVLDKVEMKDKKFKMPHELSGGEQQRIVLARALLNAPPLILADEPTGNIDPETSYRLTGLLRDLCTTGKTVIIATHQYDLIEKFPGRVLRCDNGTLTDDAELSGPQPVTEAETRIDLLQEGGMIDTPTPVAPTAIEPVPAESASEEANHEESISVEPQTEEKAPEDSEPERPTEPKEQTAPNQNTDEALSPEPMPDSIDETLKDGPADSDGSDTSADTNDQSKEGKPQDDSQDTPQPAFGFELID